MSVQALAPLIDPRIAELAQACRVRGVSIKRLLNSAGMHWPTWSNLKAGARPRARTLRKLNFAFAALDAELPPRRSPDLVKALYRMAALAIARARRVPLPDHAALFDFRAEKPNDPAWLALARVRQIAMYVVTVEFQIENAELGRAIGCTRQNVKKARDTVEDLREAKPAIAALIARVAALAEGM